MERPAGRIKIHMWYAQRRQMIGDPESQALGHQQSAGFATKSTARKALIALLEDEVKRWLELDPKVAAHCRVALAEIRLGKDRAVCGGVAWQVYEIGGVEL